MIIPIFVKTENYNEFFAKETNRIYQLKLLIDTDRRKVSQIVSFTSKKGESNIEESYDIDFLGTISKLVKLGYFSDINPVSTILSEKQFLCFYLHDIFCLKSDEIASMTKNSPSTIRDHLAKAKKRIIEFNQKLSKMNLDFTILNNLSAIPFESLKKLTSSGLISIEDIKKIVSLNPFFKIMIRDSEESPFRLYNSINSLPEENCFFIVLPLTNMFEKAIYLEKKIEI